MMWHTCFRTIINPVAVLGTSFGFASTDATAGREFIIDLDSTDVATDSDYSGYRNPVPVGAHRQDLLSLADAPTSRGRSDAYSGGALLGFGGLGRSRRKVS